MGEAEAARTVRVGDYLIERLAAHGVGHVFGVPGDFALALMGRMTAPGSPLTLVNTCDEQGAGFAADAYARVRGLGAVCVTFGVGGLKVANTTGQAFAEESPVVVISGAPGVGERARHPLLHHKIRRFDDQVRVFERLTAAQAVLDDPETATREIDRVLEAALRLKRPVYLELPRDLVDAEAEVHPRSPRPPAASDPGALAAALAEATDRLRAARRPVLVLGVEAQRFGLVDEVLRLVEATGMPVAETLLGKSAIDNDHPRYIGLYAGKMGRERTWRYVEGSDCLLLLGTALTDLEMGGFTAELDPARCIHATRGRLAIGYHVFERVEMGDFVRGLAAAGLPRCPEPDAPWTPERAALPPLDPATPITVDRLFARLAHCLTEGMVVIADPGDALFGAAELPIRRGTGFLSPAYYASLGFAVPAGLGVGLAEPGLRPLVLVGDGAFQMTGQELSTAVRFGVAPVVVVLNNDGYGTERFIADGTFNDVLRWNYAKLPELLGAGRGFRVETDGDLAAALAAAFADPSTYAILDIRLGRFDVSAALRRLTERLR
jgi:TPP-dependent 2-oxoacid decarboxylase